MKRELTYRREHNFGQSFPNEIIDHIADKFEPEEIYDDDTLDRWAVNNGYVHESNLTGD